MYPGQLQSSALGLDSEPGVQCVTEGALYREDKGFLSVHAVEIPGELVHWGLIWKAGTTVLEVVCAVVRKT